MRTCPQCGELYLPNTLFCESCGMTLRTPTANHVSPPTSGGPGSGPLCAVTCEIASSGRQIELLLTGTPLVIGRSDSGAGIIPSLDLADDGGMESGVSRRHARMLVQGDQVLIEDLHSANGTWVNDTKLSPNQPLPLRHGDLVRLGRLVMRVSLLSDHRPIRL